MKIRRAAVTIAAAAFLGTAGPAAAWVRTKATSGVPLAWSSGCVFVSLSMEGTTDIPATLIAPTFERCMASWNTGIATCGYLKLMRDADVVNTEVGLDGKNIVKFRQDKWCRPATKDTPEKCYAPQAAGITTVFYVDKAGDPHDGEILDADVELNAANFRFAVDGQTADNPTDCGAPGQTPCPTIADLQNTLTHELGHLIGLDHTCNDDPEHPTTDGDGNPVPGCSSPQLTQVERDATMFAFQEDGETKKDTLEADDIAGACNAYPTAKDPKSCSHVNVSGSGACSCDAAGRGQPPAGPLAFVLLACLGWLRRSRSPGNH